MLSTLSHSGGKTGFDAVREITCRQWLVVVAGLLFAVGLMMVASASMGVAEAQFGNTFYFFSRHLIYLGIGLVAGLITYQLPVVFWQRAGWMLFFLGLALLVLVLIPHVGRRVNGSMRWLGFGPITIQPSELAKLFVVNYLAGYLVRRQHEVRSRWSGFLKPFAVLSLVVALLLLEPDFGSVVVTMSAVIGMLFLAGTPLPQFMVLIFGSAGAGVLIAIAEPYRWKRLTAFTDPWADQFNSGYQLTQSLIAFGRGDWFGVGLGNSVQKLFYLPEAHTDFVFAVFAEEFGLLGVTAVIMLFFALVACALTIGRRAEEAGNHFAGYLANGIGLLIGVQALINIGVNTGFFPTKGLTLPLISYGGSSLVVAFIMLAIILRVDAETRLAQQVSGRKRNG